MFFAIDRTFKFTFVRLEKRAISMTARAFFEVLIEAVPYLIHAILTERAIESAIGTRTMASGIHFAPLPKNRSGMTARYMGIPFGNLCRDHEIEHRLTKPKHPWTKGPPLSDCLASACRAPGRKHESNHRGYQVKRFHYGNRDQLRRHLSNFVDAYNFARRLKTSRGLTPYGFICKIWTSEPERFTMESHHQMP